MRIKEGNEAKEIVCETISSEGINPPSENENIFQQKKKSFMETQTFFFSFFSVQYKQSNIVRANDVKIWVLTVPVIF